MVDKRGLTVGVFCVGKRKVSLFIIISLFLENKLFIPGWPLGAILMIGVAYSTRNWMHMQLVFAVFSLLLFVFYFVVRNF